MDVQFTDHGAEVLAEFERALNRALTRIGQQARGYAVDLCPVDTGNLRNSIAFKADQGERAVYIGTNNAYAAYVEFGTGIYYPGGRQTPWFYTDAKGEGHWTRGMKARPFLKPAAADHGSEYRKIFEQVFKNS